MNLFSASVSSSVLRRYKINNSPEFTVGAPTHRGRDTLAGISSSSSVSQSAPRLQFFWISISSAIHAVQFEIGSLPVKGFFCYGSPLSS